MHIGKVFAGLLFSMLMMTLTAFAEDVSTDYDHKVDFSRYKTYTWIHPPMIADALMRQRVEDAINRQLQEKGLRLVTSPERAELGVVVNAATKEKRTLQTLYDGFPGGWAWNGWGTATTVENTYEVGTLVVDLFDMETKRVVWRGVGTATLSDKPEKNEKKIDQVAEKMFKHFPKRLT